ncbi:MAG: helix-turn-helix domain-containing protein [Rhizobacter sp.]
MNLHKFVSPLSIAERHSFAQRCGTTYNHLRNVTFSGRSCGIPLASAIERESGGAVRRWTLRRHDWHQIWPELIGTEGAPPVPVTEPAAQEAA